MFGKINLPLFRSEYAKLVTVNLPEVVCDWRYIASGFLRLEIKLASSSYRSKLVKVICGKMLEIPYLSFVCLTVSMRDIVESGLAKGFEFSGQLDHDASGEVAVVTSFMW